MANNSLKPWTYLGMLLVIIFSAQSHADSNYKALTNVLEEVRITDILSGNSASNKDFKVSNTPGPSTHTSSFGTINYEHVGCTNCTKGSLNYNQTAKLINPFGATKNIKELDSWNGSRAQITYRMFDNHILEIKILP
jgi:hypothetical protein